MTKFSSNSQAELSPLAACLPWSGTPVRANPDLRAYLETRLGSEQARYLPASITLFADLEIGDAEIQEFLSSMADFLKIELANRLARQKRFVDLGLFTADEIDAFLTRRTQLQPWAIYYSRDGGLGIAEDWVAADQADCGVIPCSTMRNHGVAWRRDGGIFHLWLATARKVGQPWDWDSDIGHESAHAAFAPIPLFSQTLFQAGDISPFNALAASAEMSPAHVALLVYYFMEIAVCAVRGESRATETGLPLGGSDALGALLRLSEELFPEDGFDRARAAFSRSKGTFDVESGSDVYQLTAPIMRVIPRLSVVLGEHSAPGRELLQTCASS